MQATRRPQNAHRGFTLIEILVVITIIALISAIALPTILPALNERRVSESARDLQAILAGTRDVAIRANAPRGIRLLPDPVFNGLNGMPLASNRIIPIEPGPDYTEGLVTALPYSLSINANSNLAYASIEMKYNGTPYANPINNGTAINGAPGGTYLILAESDFSSGVPNNPTSWTQNVRQGDKIRFNDSGAYYTIAGPVNGPPFTTNNSNVERVISCLPNSPTIPLAGPSGWIPEFLFLMNGQDDNGNGWVDEACDGIDNDGDGIIDPGFNGVDDSGYINGVAYGANGIIDEPAEMMISRNGTNAAEFEQEVFVGSQASSPPVNMAYTISRRPVVSPGARETTLPAGVVIDLTTFNAPAASKLPISQAQPVLLPERSRLPVDAFTGNVDIMIDQSGRVITPGAGMDGGGTYANSPLSSLPFYHFWLTEREGVVSPMFNPVGTTTLPAPVRNGNYGPAGTSQNYMLPMPNPTPNYSAPSVNGVPVYLIGERRLVTLFVKTGQIVSNSILNFDGYDTNAPFYDAQSGIKEPQ